MSRGFEYIFPAIRGIQAGREYYVTMCPLKLIPKIFLFNEEELNPEVRAQRQLNKNRIPELSRYITNNKDSYVFSAITASIDADIKFQAASELDEEKKMGLLKVPMTAQFLINDGQHRRAAIEVALRENPEIGDETIAVVFFLDAGLVRSQQMFADLNRFSIRPSSSLNVLYDHRDNRAKLARELISSSEIFRGVVELEKTTLSARSRKLFTLSAIFHATSELVKNLDFNCEDEKEELVVSFWNEVSSHMKEWSAVQSNTVTAGEIRAEFINSHGVVLQALARIGNALLIEHPDNWQSKLSKLSKINWRRSNSKDWEGRAMIAGKISKSQQNVILTANRIKQILGIELSNDENAIENQFKRGNYESSEAA